ncbi:MAG: hypothetical protein HYY18_01475 [Planctomycetes bacterium]|nr:hypothetical protein [Planctomycetota bacterium]
MRLMIPVIFALVMPAGADEPPSWEEFSVASPGGTHVALVERAPDADAKKPGWEVEWVLRVHKCGGKPGAPAGEPLWTAKYAATGYAGGHLSDGGKRFVQVEDWFHPGAAALRFYSGGAAPVVVTGTELGIPPAKLQRTASHRVWRGTPQPDVPFSDGGRVFTVATVDGVLRAFDADTGRSVGRASGDLRAAAWTAPRTVTLGSKIPVSFAVRNDSDAPVEVWHADDWVNHRLVLAGPDGKAVDRTETGEGALKRFGSGDRDRNESVDLAPGAWDEQLKGVDLGEHFKIEAPGRYELRIEYSDLCGEEKLSVVSAALAITIVDPTFAKFQALAEALIGAIEDGEDDLAWALLGEKGQEDLDPIREVMAKHNYRALAADLGEPQGDKATLGGHDSGHLHVRMIRVDGRWRVAEVAWCR